MSFPRIVGPPQPESKIGELERVKGKTIKSVELGEEEKHPGTHQSELMILHFTDGTSMAIQIGSNARNLADRFEGMDTREFSTDFIILWE
ncbi:MAG: hypothetical protein WAZ30_15125 [Syntrophorhabdus sp.]